jgi:pimeloyl-ACP methyl ester carboxylesterase
VQFYGANRPGAKVSQGILDQFWLWSMQAGALNSYECVKAFSETDFTEDLKKFDFPTLVLHGEDDQIVPVMDSARKSAKLVKGEQEIYYPGRFTAISILLDREAAPALGASRTSVRMAAISPWYCSMRRSKVRRSLVQTSV